MDRKIAIVSARTLAVPPSQTVVIECENVFAAALKATIVPVFEQTDGGDPIGFDTLIFVAINHWQLSRMMSAAVDLRRRSGACYAYVFDSLFRYLTNWTGRFPAPLRSSVKYARHEVRNLRTLKRVFAPTALTLPDQADFFGVPFTYIPIGVDAVRFGSARRSRCIAVNAYGRQPPDVGNYLADAMNAGASDLIYHHTGHQEISTVSDPTRHRRHFWKLLTHSKLALAYAPEAYDPHQRFDCSFVGQRWFESIAAGCVIVGRRPSAPESDALFDWPDALIDLPEEPHDALDAVLHLLDQPERLARSSQRNYREALERHDWRHRIADMATVIGLEADPSVLSEVDEKLALEAPFA